MRITRMIAAVALIFFGAAAVSSPAVALHESFLHVDHHHGGQGRETSAAIEGHHHSHGGHDHSVLQTASNRPNHRPDSRAELVVYVGFVSGQLGPDTSGHILTTSLSTPPRPRLSLLNTTILRI